jgi:hypothetical protein
MLNNRATTAAAATTVVQANSEIEALIVNQKTLAFVQAIKKGDAVRVLACINEGVDVNAIVPDDSMREFVNDSKDDVALTFSTPLGLAVYQLEYDIVKMLLEHGANPNIDGSHDGNAQSLIERLMMGISIIDMNNVLGQPTKRNLTFFGISSPFKVSKTISPAVIDNVEKLLDLLLCYDLNPDIAWTNAFKKSNEMLISAIEDCHSFQAKQDARLELINAFRNIFKNRLKELSMKNKLELIVSRGILWLGRKIEKRDSVYHLPDYIASVSEVQDKAKAAVTEIKQEKVALNNAIESALKGVSGWVKEITNIASEYTNFSKEVAEKRLKEKKTLKFWKTVDQKKVIALETKKITQIKIYEIFTNDLKEIINKKDEKPYDIVMEYLVDPTTEIGQDPSKATPKNTTMVKP